MWNSSFAHRTFSYRVCLFWVLDVVVVLFALLFLQPSSPVSAAINVIANGGEYVPPRLHLGSIDADAQFNPVDAPVPERVLSEPINAQMVDMLSAVVEKGTGKRAAVPGYTVAVKTGTAQKIQSDGAYSDTDYVSTFAGFLPAENPQISVVVLLDEPRTDYLASSVAAPLFAEITAKATRILKVAPDA